MIGFNLDELTAELEALVKDRLKYSLSDRYDLPALEGLLPADTPGMLVYTGKGELLLVDCKLTVKEVLLPLQIETQILV